MTWVRYPAGFTEADCALHSGICVDVLANNTEWAAKENGFDITIGPPMNPGTVDEWKSDTLDDEEWAPVLSECCSIPLRSSATGFAMRSVGVEVVGACSGAGTITARVYLRGSRSTDARDTGYPGETCYCTLTFEETTYERETGTITDPVAAPPIPVYADPGDAIESEPPTCGMANLEIIAISADGIALYIDSVRLIEGEP